MKMALKNLTPILITSMLIACSGGDKGADSKESQKFSVEPNVSQLPKEVQDILSTSPKPKAIEDRVKKKPVLPTQRNCALVIGENYSRIYHNEATVESLKADDPCMLPIDNIKTLPPEYQVIFYILAKQPELLDDESVFYTYACINDRPLVEHFVDNEFAWPKVQAAIRSRTADQLKALETLSVETAFGQKHLLGSYDHDKGGFPVVAKAGFSSMPVDGLVLDNPGQFQKCKNGIGGLKGNIKNWYGAGYPFEFIFSPPLSDIFVPMAADKAEKFISETVPETSREVQLRVKFSLGDFKRGFGNKAIFTTELQSVTVEHVAFKQPLLVRKF